MVLNIEALLPQHQQAKRIYVAYSGGVDSHVLLHLCAMSPMIKNKLSAVYVHHGLQLAADAWADHCQRTAEALGVDCLVLRVNASPKSGESPEEAARNARYQALKPLLSAEDVLVVAQHQQDQLETMLLQLFRGSGLKGLSAMPEVAVFGKGLLLRPLLNIGKHLIDEYAKSQALQWIEDPTNKLSDYDRNFLRNDIVPQLQQRWPGLAKSVSRSAQHCAEAQAMLADVAKDLLANLIDVTDNTLPIDKLLQLSAAEQRWVIRQWFGQMGLKMPSQATLGRLFTEVLAANDDREPLLAGKEYCLRRYRNKLFCLQTKAEECLFQGIWDSSNNPLYLGGGDYLCWSVASQGIALSVWEQAQITVQYRQGGEKIRLPHRQGSHDLKKLYQEAGIPPWQRSAMPLIYLDGRLAAVADRWLSADFYQESLDDCVRLHWQSAVAGQKSADEVVF